MKYNLYKYKIESGKLEKIEDKIELSVYPESAIEEYYIEMGWDVENISPSQNNIEGVHVKVEKGIPDLYLKKEGKRKFIEVKGDSDGLRLTQIDKIKNMNYEVDIIYLEIVEDEEFSCSDCGKIFDSKSALNIHKSQCYTEPEESPIKTSRYSFS